MAGELSQHEQYLRRIDSLAMSALPIPDGLLAAVPTHHDGVMVALVPDSPEELALGGENALPADDLHITLCYLGKTKDFGNFEKSEILSTTRRVCDEVGHAFSSKADGVVVMGSNDEGVPATALLIQAEDIVTLYDALAAALKYESKYPSFIPHMTTGYGVPFEQAQDLLGTTVHFSAVLVKFGDDKHVIPLTESLVAAPRGVNTIDRVIDSLGRLWDEALHPRDGEGMFIKKNGAVSGRLSVPTKDRKGVQVVDANRASVVGFHTFDNDVWVLAEITSPDGSKVQGFAKAADVHSTAPVKARLDALYPVDRDLPDTNGAQIERNRQIDLLLAHINKEFGSESDGAGALSFLETLGLRDDDLDYIFDTSGDNHLDGFKKVDRTLTPDELDEVENIIDDARQVKELRDRVHGLKEATAEPADFDNIGATWRNNEVTAAAKEEFRKLSPDDYVVVYHGTKNKDHYDSLVETGRVGVPEDYKSDLPTSATDSLYVAPTRADAEQYGDYVVAIQVQKKDLAPSPEAMRTKPDVDVATALFNSFDGAILPPDLELNIIQDRDAPDIESHVAPKQQLLVDADPADEAAAAIKGGADPLSLDTDNLLEAMRRSERFDQPSVNAVTGISEIEWYVDPNDTTGTDAYLAGTGTSTKDKAYFVKKSVFGAEFGNTDIVNEVLSSLIAEQLADALGEDDDRLIPIPKSRFGDNPVWDGNQGKDNGPLNTEIHQPAYVIQSHVAYAVPPEWKITNAADEETRLHNDIRNMDDFGKSDAIAAHEEDMGDIYGNSVAQMIIWDYVTLNADRNPNNALLASPGDGYSEGKALPIDHGFSFADESLADINGPNQGPLDEKEAFDVFMSQDLTKAWLAYVLGGLDLANNVSEDSIRRTLKDAVDVYGNIDMNEILSRLKAMPNITDDQAQEAGKSLAGVIGRAEWLANNMDEVLRRLTTR